MWGCPLHPRSPAFTASSASQRHRARARSRCPVATCEVSDRGRRMGRAAAEERGEGGKILRIPTPEAQESPGEEVTGSSPQTCQRAPPLFTWLALARGPLRAPLGAGQWVPPHPRPPSPGGPRPQASRQGPCSRPAASVNLQPKRGAPLREFVSRKGSKPSSIGAYVHRAINRKDLQSSPGPQQPRTLSGITYDDLSHQRGQLSH